MSVCFEIDSFGLVGLVMIMVAGQIVIYSLKAYGKDKK